MQRRRAASAAAGVGQASCGAATLRSSRVSCRARHSSSWDLPGAGSRLGDGGDGDCDRGGSPGLEEAPGRERSSLTFAAAVALALAHPAAAALQQSAADVAAASARAAATQPGAAPPARAADAVRASLQLLGLGLNDDDGSPPPQPLASTPRAWH